MLADLVAPQWPYSGGARWPPQGPHGMSDVDGHGHGPNGPMMMPGIHQLPFVPYPGGGFRNVSFLCEQRRGRTD
jgi:hypothetical protein